MLLVCYELLWFLLTNFKGNNYWNEDYGLFLQNYYLQHLASVTEP